MRRADRLFRIIQILRRRRTPITANEIAEEMETSLRTIYRDISQLLADRVPIRGEIDRALARTRQGWLEKS